MCKKQMICSGLILLFGFNCGGRNQIGMESDSGLDQDSSEYKTSDGSANSELVESDDNTNEDNSNDSSNEIDNASSVDALDASTSDSTTTLGVLDPSWTIPDELLLCDDGPCQCANGIDDDGDGQVDGFDMECTGPYDDDEGSFATGIPGDNRDWKWQDCFFDGNSGGGDDGCRYHSDCLTGVLEQDHQDCEVTQQCLEYCITRTPNGCDCFGCCTVIQYDGTEINILISDQCSEEHLDQCTTCVPNTNCINECGECELCPGRTVEDLPEKCFTNDQPTPDGGVDTSDSSTPESDGGKGYLDTGVEVPPGEVPPPYTCDNGEQVCTNQSDCDSGYFCWQGCCLMIII